MDGRLFQDPWIGSQMGGPDGALLGTPGDPNLGDPDMVILHTWITIG